jgi:hypothetical protein
MFNQRPRARQRGDIVAVCEPFHEEIVVEADGQAARPGCSDEPDHARQRASGQQPQRVPWRAQDHHHRE